MKLSKGDPAPDFALPDAEGKEWRLSDLRGQKVIVYFYPADDTPGCTAEACDFRDSQSALTQAGYTVLGISPQGAESKQRFVAKYGLNFPLLVDENTEVAESYGTAEDGGDYKGIPLRVKRATFVVDEEGKVAEAQYGVRAQGHVAGLKESFGL